MNTTTNTIQKSPSPVGEGRGGVFTIYNASAGSGKTYTLAVQYITRLLASGRDTDNAYRQMLAVTFTNKATAEMKDRILQQLYGISTGLEASDGYLSSVRDELHAMHIEIDDATIRREAGRALHAILHDYSRFRVETIDTFFRGVLTDMARELGLPTGLKADIDSARVISEAVDRIIERLTVDDTLRGWVTEFVTERIEDGKRWDVASDIKQFATHIFDAEYLTCQDALTDFLCDNDSVKRLRDKLTETQQEMTAALADFLTHVEEVCADPSVANLKNSRYLFSHIAKVRAAIDGAPLEEPTKSVRDMAANPANLLKAKHTSEEETLAATVSEALADLLAVEDNAIRVLTTILLTRRHINPMRLLATVAREVNIVAQERGAFLLANTNILLDRMVEDDDASFIYEKTGTVLRHIMLDEFQDTSVLQWRNFQTLIRENMAKGGSTLVVGDVKQSIYRWRGGDCKILATLHEHIDQTRLERKSLRTNYRSARHIIDFNNALYTHITQYVNRLRLEQETWDIEDVYMRDEVQQAVPARRGESGYVQLVCATEDKETDTHQTFTDDMCDTIRTLIDAGHRPEDMAILIRNNRDMDMIAQAFADRLPDIPLVSDEVFALNRSAAVGILINALRAIAHPADTASLGRLVYLYHREVLRDDAGLNALFDGMDKIQPFRSACRLLPDGFADLERLHRMPIFELVMELSTMFRLNDIPGQSSYLMTFYDSITASDDDSTTSLTGLLQYWDKRLCRKSIPGGEVKGVNIMTIHRAKGLQWPTVFVPYCDWTIHDTKMQASNIMWCRTDSVPLLCGLPLAAVSATKSASLSIYADDYIREIENQRVDNLNLLYVATTRAEQNLYVWGKRAKTSNSANPTMMQLIAETMTSLPGGNLSDTDSEQRYTFGSASIAAKEQDRQASHNRLEMDYTTPSFTPRLYPALMDFRQSNEASRFTGCTDHGAPSPTQSRYINTGSVLHAIFSSITSAADIHRAVGSLPMSMTKTEDGRDLRDMAIRLLERGCNDERIADWFSGGYHLCCECEIVERDAETGRAVVHRPDRVMMDAERIVVVDFKFGKPHDEHRTQVARYMRLLQGMHPDLRVEGYLWYVYQNEIQDCAPA